MDAVMYIDGGFDGWFGLNNTAGVDALVVSNDGSTSSFAGSWDATGFGIVLDGAPSYLMGAGVVYNSELGGGSGILNGTITFNMTPAPGALALLGMAGIGSSQTILSISLSNVHRPPHMRGSFCSRHGDCFVFRMSKHALRIHKAVVEDLEARILTIRDSL